MCHALVIITVVTHIMPYLSSVGISRTISSLAVSGITLISVSGRLGAGIGLRIYNRIDRHLFYYHGIHWYLVYKANPGPVRA